jgi:uncharacterized membrane protein YtjA (UPF0391 family)
MPRLASLHRVVATHLLEIAMLYWSAAFFLIAILAAVLGFGNISSGAADIGKILFFIFIVLFIVWTILGLFRRGSRP